MSHFCAAAAILGTNLCVGETPISAVEQSFIQHMSFHGYSFATAEEYNFRLATFTATDEKINAANAVEGITYTVAHNLFSALTDDEFNVRLGYNGPQAFGDDEAMTILQEEENGAVVDWRLMGAVNEVKNQGACGSCWAFSAIAAIEGHYKLQFGTLEVFSEQQCVDCDPNSSGCNGGW
jgi:hypothetical protein